MNLRAPGSRRGRSRGISLLLELLLGLTLVSLTLLVLFGVFPMGERAVGQADRTSQASSIARTHMERALGQDYTALSTDPASYEEGDDTAFHTKRHGSELSTKFHYRVEVTQPDPDKEVKRLVVTVTWPNGSDRVETVALQSSKGKLW